MMAAMRDLLSPLGIICLVFIRGYCPLPMALQGMHPMRTRGPSSHSSEDQFVSTEDYSQYEDIVTTTSSKRLTPGGGTLQQCDYDPCLEGQTSCFQLAISTHCLCRGLPLNEVPKAPSLSSVSWNGSKVVLKWCAPYSHVTAYIVTVGGEERMTFGEGERSGAVGDIDDIAEVCVKAVNNAGASDGSCMIYHPKDNNLALTAGLIGGALGFLLLVLLVILLWRQRKQEATISMSNTAETQ
ncbi:leucine-rich repeat neuronal protein 4 [Archocentrus centrarchus]|uniref:leucine-rich repeat neuronal protein 4 n=1 Tax=Archocentrus centrarchus TaxID=63155 RepID=UPI0011E9DE6F|nr:leucine-rich repeat neuronal protein 4-like [Archocentrus centrarchus]